MRIRLLIGIADADYSNFLSDVLMDQYSETFDVSVCTTETRFLSTIDSGRMDVALADDSFLDALGNHPTNVMIFRIADKQNSNISENIRSIKKYQRISNIMSTVIEQYARYSGKRVSDDYSKAKVTMVWSPAGGTGKTTAALAYAARCVAEKKKTLYLSLEVFSGDQAYFAQNGNSISKILSGLTGDISLLMQSIRQEDIGSGIYYFEMPENYDDIAVLRDSEMEMLISAAANGVDELVVDCQSTFDPKVARLMEIADAVFVVINASKIAQMKWEQFKSQNSYYDLIRNRAYLVCNQGANLDAEDMEGKINLPRISTTDPVAVYKSLSTNMVVA